jgi:hypothetical protein
MDPSISCQGMKLIHLALRYLRFGLTNWLPNLSDIVCSVYLNVKAAPYRQFGVHYKLNLRPTDAMPSWDILRHLVFTTDTDVTLHSTSIQQIQLSPVYYHWLMSYFLQSCHTDA